MLIMQMISASYPATCVPELIWNKIIEYQTDRLNRWRCATKTVPDSLATVCGTNANGCESKRVALSISSVVACLQICPFKVQAAPKRRSGEHRKIRLQAWPLFRAQKRK
jgi:hypothetical protein